MLSGTWTRLQRWTVGRDHARATIGHENDRPGAYHAIIQEVDAVNFAWSIWIVASSGFLTDSYNLFATNVVLPAISFVYWNTSEDRLEYGFNIATLLGSMVGQVMFGWLVDVYGRKRLYGLELIIVIVSAIGLVQCSEGFRDTNGDHTWSITPWLFFWRVIMGIGIGAEYPLSACLAAEWSSTNSRAVMMGAVFLMQPLGQFAAYLVGLVAISVVPNTKVGIDQFWRIVVGLGTIPAILAWIARTRIRESWRYTMFVTDNPQQAVFDFQNTYVRDVPAPQADAQVSNGTMPQSPAMVPQMNGRSSQHGSVSTGIQLQQLRPARSGRVTRPESQSLIDEAPQGADVQHPPHVPQSTRWNYMQRLAATSICWYLLDFAFYGMGFNSPGTLSKLWTSSDISFPLGAPWWEVMSDVPSDQVDYAAISTIIKHNVYYALCTTSVAAITGSLLFVCVARWANLNRRRLFIITFALLAIVLAFIAGFFGFLFHDGAHRPIPGSTPQGSHNVLIVLWAVAQFLFNFGPNTLTFILPAELFPTRYRCTYYGIAAATGKLGAVTVQAISWRLASNRTTGGPNDYTTLQTLLASFAGAMALGAMVAFFWPAGIKDVQNGRTNLSLEQLTDDGQKVDLIPYTRPTIEIIREDQNH